MFYLVLPYERLEPPVPSFKSCDSYIRVSQNSGYLFRVPHSKDHNILGYILGFPQFWETTTFEILIQGTLTGRVRGT